MKYNRKTIVQEIVKRQTEIFEAEKRKLMVKASAYSVRLQETIASYLHSLTEENIIKSLDKTENRVMVLNDNSLAFISLCLKNDGSKAFNTFAAIYKKFYAVTTRLRIIDHYLETSGANNTTRLYRIVNRETPYGIKIEDLQHHKELIETLRDKIFEETNHA